MEGGCFAPIGCWARIENKDFFITGYAANLDGSRNLQKTVKGDIQKAEELALKLSDDMIQAGAKDFMNK